MKKLWAIAWKDVYLTFTDRNLLMIMVATPVLISTIVGMAFGSFADEGGVPFSDIPVAVVNLDQGSEQQPDPGGRVLDNGDQHAGLLCGKGQKHGKPFEGRSEGLHFRCHSLAWLAQCDEVLFLCRQVLQRPVNCDALRGFLSLFPRGTELLES